MSERRNELRVRNKQVHNLAVTVYVSPLPALVILPASNMELIRRSCSNKRKPRLEEDHYNNDYSSDLQHYWM
jgi:hypothetical protein